MSHKMFRTPPAPHSGRAIAEADAIEASARRLHEEVLAARQDYPLAAPIAVVTLLSARPHLTVREAAQRLHEAALQVIEQPELEVAR